MHMYLVEAHDEQCRMTKRTLNLKHVETRSKKVHWTQSPSMNKNVN